MHRLPPPAARPPDRWHSCQHPLVHRLSITLLLGGWLYWSCRYGLPWAVMQSQSFAPGSRLVLFCLFGLGWIVLIIPSVTSALYVLATHDCGPWPEELGHPKTWRQGHPGSVQAPRSPAVPGRRTTERIIFSPDAAEQRFGIRGKIIIERDTED